MFFLFHSPYVRCFACEREGRTRIGRAHQAAFLAAAAFAWGVAQVSFWDFGWLLPAGLSVYLLLNKHAHRCRACGSSFVKKVAAR